MTSRSRAGRRGGWLPIVCLSGTSCAEMPVEPFPSLVSGLTFSAGSMICCGLIYGLGASLVNLEETEKQAA